MRSVGSSVCCFSWTVHDLDMRWPPKRMTSRCLTSLAFAMYSTSVERKSGHCSERLSLFLAHHFSVTFVTSSSSAADCWLRGACLVFNSRHCFRRDCISISVGTLYAWPCVSVRPLKHGRSTSLRRRSPTSNSQS